MPEIEYVELKHPRFKRVQRDIFSERLAPDCMAHECRLRKAETGQRKKLDACCQYGVDVDLGERDGILSHAEQIAEILDDEVPTPWFDSEEKQDVDFPSGAFVRTKTHDKGCVFLSHSARGCAIHRASIEGGWDFHGIKPHVCRLFPISYDETSIVMSDDYADYSCAYEPNSPTVYQVGRADLAAIFGMELVEELDRIAQDVLFEEPTKVLR